MKENVSGCFFLNTVYMHSHLLTLSKPSLLADETQLFISSS